MKVLAGIMLLSVLAACGGPRTETFVCPNGPDLSVTYAEASAIVTLSDGRSVLLPADPAREGVYAKPGFAWADTSFRSGRLTDGSKSYGCDQSSVR